MTRRSSSDNAHKYFEIRSLRHTNHVSQDRPEPSRSVVHCHCDQGQLGRTTRLGIGYGGLWLPAVSDPSPPVCQETARVTSCVAISHGIALFNSASTSGHFRRPFSFPSSFTRFVLISPQTSYLRRHRLSAASVTPIPARRHRAPIPRGSAPPPLSQNLLMISSAG